jgi:squalene-hopene/tetraprenyl-beta-curcumene cyclase
VQLIRSIILLSVALPVFGADWSPQLAADYLDSRQKEWSAWKPAKAVGGSCLSCHTGMTYLFARPALRRALGEKGPTAYETGLLDGLRARLDKKSAEGEHASQALGVESVLSALFLGSDEAFDRMWSLQKTDGEAKGTWDWFSLGLDPWEMPESRFVGATLAAIATGSAPAAYRSRPEVREKVAALTAYLQNAQQAQSLHNRLMLLWASTQLPAALPEKSRRPIMDDLWRRQQADGGWTMEALGPWKPHAAAPASTGSNAYATGLAAFVMQKAGVTASDPRLAKALAWLKANQDKQNGYWSADSMNKVFEPGSMQVKFMRDAATSFATLALLEAR